MLYCVIFMIFCLPFIRPGSEEKSDSLNLRRDGLYNTYDTSRMSCGLRKSDAYRTYQPLLILNDSNCSFINGADRGNTTETLQSYVKEKKLVDGIGRYFIVYNKIRVEAPTVFFIRGMRMRSFITHFEGIIKNRDTILNWHMVPPYPDVPTKFNNDFKNLLQPKLLYFIESKELLGLDSLYQLRLREEAQNKRK